jgi:hypothetical protein
MSCISTDYFKTEQHIKLSSSYFTYDCATGIFCDHQKEKERLEFQKDLNDEQYELE